MFRVWGLESLGAEGFGGLGFGRVVVRVSSLGFRG